MNGSPDCTELQAEIERLNKVIRALMNRAERSTEVQGSDFSLFQMAIMLEEQVRVRTVELEAALAETERIGSALRKSEAKFWAIFDMTPSPIALTRLNDGKVVEVSRSFYEYFRLPVANVGGRSTLAADLNLWVNQADRDRWRDLLLSDGEVTDFETDVRDFEGNVSTVLISGKVIEIDDEKHVVADLRDISEHKRRAEYLERIASHDPLTGLPNRLLISDRLTQAIGRNSRGGTRVAVCYLDLDGFKAINDGHGHEAGDRVLVEVARRLQSSVRSGDTVARLGGDEFVVLLADLADESECQVALVRLLRVVSAPYHVNGNEHHGISASIGVTVFPNDDSDPDTLVRHADHAMYAAKQAGKNRFQMFDPRLEQRLEARQATLRELTHALETEQFRLYYQPKVDCRRGRVVGVEALLRWQHPMLGLRSPAEFIPLIEDTELAVAVGDWVIRTAWAQMLAWHRAGADFGVSVNAFVRHLLHPDFVDSLAAVLRGNPEVPTSRFQIEIVETAALKELKTIRAVVEECRALGVSFSLDDFGTGYSTLAHLRHLPAEEIKIDQSFVKQMLERAEDRVIVEAVVALARAFDRVVVAEGAETHDHVMQLLDLGCDVMQGYAFARPMAAENVLEWIGAFTPDERWRLGAGGKSADGQFDVQGADHGRERSLWMERFPVERRR